MTLTRVSVATQATLTHVFTVARVATDATGSVTVTVTRLDGTAVVSGTATHSGVGTYTYLLPTSAVLDTWSVSWSATVSGAAVVATDSVEIVGGYLFDLDRAISELAIPVTTTQATLERMRNEVEQECELRICYRAFVPRYAREVRNGTDTERLVLAHSEPRKVRTVTVAGVAWTADQIAGITLISAGTLRLADGVLWPAGSGNVVVEYEHGWDAPPEEVSTAAITRLQSKIALRSSGIPTRAQSFAPGDGGTYRLVLPDRDSTGLPDVDAVYQRYARLRRAVTA